MKISFLFSCGKEAGEEWESLELSFLKQLSCGVAATGSELSEALHLLQNSVARAEERVAGTVFLLSALRNLPGARRERDSAELPGDFERIAPALRFLARHSCDSICFHDLGPDAA